MSARVIALVPSHNRADTLAETIYSLLEQTYPVTILVVLDNCSDPSRQVVQDLQLRHPSLHCIETVDNTARKAGALNQALALVLAADLVLTLDDDTLLDTHCVEMGVRELLADQSLAAICSRAGVAPFPAGKSPWQKLLWSLQRLEYAGFDAHRVETHGAIKVIHGMCALYRTQALQQIAQSREDLFGLWQVFREDNLVEDYDLTLALKEQGWRVSASMEMRAWTEVPLRLRDLWAQRLRWNRGGVDSLREHRWNRATRWDIMNHGLFLVNTVLQTIVAVFFVLWLFGNHAAWPFGGWSMAAVIAMQLNAIYRLRYVDKLTFGTVLLRFLLIPETIYSWFHMVVLLRSYVLSFAKVTQSW